MKKYNVILVYDKDAKNILMCKREKEPFKNKYNFVGGKVEENELIEEAAYRELKEETGIENIKLTYIMNIQYIIEDFELEIFAGKLSEDVILKEETNKLYWINMNDKFFNIDKYAGFGNIWHMIKYVENKTNLLK